MWSHRVRAHDERTRRARRTGLARVLAPERARLPDHRGIHHFVSHHSSYDDGTHRARSPRRMVPSPCFKSAEVNMEKRLMLLEPIWVIRLHGVRKQHLVRSDQWGHPLGRTMCGYDASDRESGSRKVKMLTGAECRA